MIFLAALLTRLAILPWSQMVHADAVTRVFLALNWLEHPHYITDGYWGPMHHYLNALFLSIFPGRDFGPKMLNVLLASLTVIPMYRFTLNVFDNRRGAVFVALLYVFSPIVMRNSFQALAGVSYAFFVASSMYFISEGIKKNVRLSYAALAGIAITFAAATRYEAWVIIAAFTLVLSILKQWKFTVVFWLCAMIFPATWMIGNQLKFGDFLYSVNQNDVWNIQLEGINDNVDAIERIKRVLFFPMSFMFNISPITLALLLWGLFVALKKRAMEKTQWVWLIPFGVMFVVFMQKAWAGTLMLQHRFILTWIVLGLPFLTMTFKDEKKKKLKTKLMVVAIATAIPLSFCWWLFPYEIALRWTNLGKAVDQMAVGTFQEFEAIPLLRDKPTEILLETINGHSVEGNGLVLDFFGWDRTYYTTLHVKNRVYITEGAKHGRTKHDDLDEYLDRHPKGLIVFNRVGRLYGEATFYDSLVQIKSINHALIVKEVYAPYNWLKLFEYEAVNQWELDSMKAHIGEQTFVFPSEEDREYYKVLMQNDAAWYRSVKRMAIWKRQTIEESLDINADYVIRKLNGEEVD